MRFRSVTLETSQHVERLGLVSARAQHVLHFDQIEEGFRSQQEGRRNDEAPLPPGADPSWKPQPETWGKYS